VEEPATGSEPWAGRVAYLIVELAGIGVAKCQRAMSLLVLEEV